MRSYVNLVWHVTINRPPILSEYSPTVIIFGENKETDDQNLVSHSCLKTKLSASEERQIISLFHGIG